MFAWEICLQDGFTDGATVTASLETVAVLDLARARASASSFSTILAYRHSQHYHLLDQDQQQTTNQRGTVQDQITLPQ